MRLVQTALHRWRINGRWAAGRRGRHRRYLRGRSQRRHIGLVVGEGWRRRVLVGLSMRYEFVIAGSARPRRHIGGHAASPARPMIGNRAGAARPERQTETEHRCCRNEPLGDHVSRRVARTLHRVCERLIILPVRAKLHQLRRHADTLLCDAHRRAGALEHGQLRFQPAAPGFRWTAFMAGLWSRYERAFLSAGVELLPDDVRGWAMPATGILGS
jgi:hypothetical protein